MSADAKGASAPRGVWLNLTSRDPRKKPILALIRKAAGVATSRVTLCKVSKDGKLAKGRVLETGEDVTVEVTS